MSLQLTCDIVGDLPREAHSSHPGGPPDGLDRNVGCNRLRYVPDMLRTGAAETPHDVCSRIFSRIPDRTCRLFSEPVESSAGLLAREYRETVAAQTIGSLGEQLTDV